MSRRKFSIRAASAQDVMAMIALSSDEANAAHWTAEQWRAVFAHTQPRRLAWVAVAAETAAPGNVAAASVAGFLVAQCEPAWELENLAIAPDFRRQGIGRALVATLIQAAQGVAADNILLEVRASNQAAIRLYQLSGFTAIARRRDYYDNPPEDALIFRHPLR